MNFGSIECQTRVNLIIALIKMDSVGYLRGYNCKFVKFYLLFSVIYMLISILTKSPDVKHMGKRYVLFRKV